MANAAALGLESLALWLLEFVNWGISILAIMLIWEFMRLINMGRKSDPAMAAGGMAKNLWSHIPGTAGNARRTHKRELNEYIMEKVEEKELDELKASASTILSDFEVLANRKYFTQGQQLNLIRAVQAFGDLLNDNARKFRSLGKATSRSDNSLDKMFNYFKSKGIKVPQEVKALENNIMVLHRDTAKEIQEVQDLYREITDSEPLKKFKAIPKVAFDKGPYKVETNSDPFTLAHLYDLVKHFRDEKFLLEEAYKKQAEAEREMLGIIEQTRTLYEN